jgi:predicted transcriptional regulator
MKKLTVPVLDDKDKEFVESLVNVGLNRNISKTLVYLANVEETLSRDIEIGANLRQPEVSLVMRELRAHGWVGEREIKKEGKGRPVKCYTLSVGLADIISSLEESKKKEAQAHLKNIEKLRLLSDKIK